MENVRNVLFARNLYPEEIADALKRAMNDVSEAAHQPMHNPAKDIWIVYNGEVYNFLDERRILEAKGFRFKSASDTEVVLRMYEHYGDDFLLRLQGIFALAIYDMRGGPGRERMLLAGDHLGHLVGRHGLDVP